MDENVEVTFTVSPLVRKIRFHGGWSKLSPETLAEDGVRLFFSPSLRMSEDMKEWSRKGFRESLSVRSGEPLRFTRNIEEGWDWGLLVPTLHAVCVLRVEDGAANEVHIQVIDGLTLPQEATVGPGDVTFTVENRSEDPEILVTVMQFELPDPEPEEGAEAESADEDEGEDDGEDEFMNWLPFLTGTRLLSTQSFRELFQTESLSREQSLEIKSLAILFTDLKASTALYGRVGDLRALELVRAHFDVLKEVIDAHDGAIVKTIGDAVMATFTDPRQAALAGVRMHRAMHELASPEELALKVGVHVGPCVAIESNQRVDFFGQAVNIAARVQALAEGNELVVTDDLLREPGIAAALGDEKITLVREQAHLKGIDGAVLVHRARVE